MLESGLSQLLTVKEAISILDGVEVHARTVVVDLDRSAGLVLAEDLRADRDYPPFRKSLMDGYAIRAADVAGGSAELRLVGEIAAGAWPSEAIQPGEAMAIMTGAPMPPGADGVVPVEDVEERVAVGSILRVVRAAGVERFVAAAASDCPSGRIVLQRGMRLGPAQIAVAASIGAARLSCFARPRVAILGTGDELVAVDQTPSLGQIRDSNTPMLAALLGQLGCEVVSVSTVRDEPEALGAALKRGMEADAFFVAGGMSMGAYDYVPGLLKEMGVQIKITKLSIKPGKPFMFGVGPASRAMVFGLPGNPVSAFVCTVRLAGRVLSRLAGGKPGERWLSARLARALPANGAREFYQPALWSANNSLDGSAEELPNIAPLSWKGSADVFALAGANALLMRPSNDPPREAGSIVRYLEI